MNQPDSTTEYDEDLLHACSILKLPTGDELPSYRIFHDYYYLKRYHYLLDLASATLDEARHDAYLLEMTQVAHAFVKIHRALYKEMNARIDPTFALRFNKEYVEKARRDLRKRLQVEAIVAEFRVQIEASLSGSP